MKSLMKYMNLKNRVSIYLRIYEFFRNNILFKIYLNDFLQLF